MAGLAATPDALARNLAYLQTDLTDVVFRVNLLTNAPVTRKEIESLLEAAVLAGDLEKNVNAPRLARTIEAIIGGSLRSWACYREGPVAVYLIPRRGL